ncbi:MAG: hypothetical protein Q9198_000865 [Flavoplaca austrocitrina]
MTERANPITLLAAQSGAKKAGKTATINDDHWHRNSSPCPGCLAIGHQWNNTEGLYPALEHHNDGLTPVKNFFRYKGLIKELVDDLKLQTLLLRNTCEQLLTGVVESDTELVSSIVL